ncbi:hypothetical protein Asi03nite_22450 [Actinoplanes siamensis]|uniref:Uncharacterized protein n=1 Tax=Actinoplanes siamensis TaxID=1223317 RepID=A0A919N5J4_9ACTN|nr:hypothetical protein Asi03nite_22450 [Actinoplanes siamensis]
MHPRHPSHPAAVRRRSMFVLLLTSVALCGGVRHVAEEPSRVSEVGGGGLSQGGPEVGVEPVRDGEQDAGRLGR